MTIKSEYEHNVSQQIYVSAKTWDVVLAAKEELINTINKAESILPQDADSLDLIKEIMEHYMGHDRRPMQAALDKIKQDVQKLF